MGSADKNDGERRTAAIRKLKTSKETFPFSPLSSFLFCPRLLPSFLSLTLFFSFLPLFRDRKEGKSPIRRGRRRREKGREARAFNGRFPQAAHNAVVGPAGPSVSRLVQLRPFQEYFTIFGLKGRPGGGGGKSIRPRRRFRLRYVGQRPASIRRLETLSPAGGGSP